ILSITLTVSVVLTAKGMDSLAINPLDTQKTDSLSDSLIPDTLKCSTGESYDKAIRDIPNPSFGVGEELNFSINWGFVHVGSARMSVKPLVNKNKRPCYELEATARSNKTISNIYHVNDLFLSYLDTAALIPHEYLKYQNEGSYHFDQHAIFDQKLNTVKVWGKRTKKNSVINKDTSFAIPQMVYDVISAFYYTRVLDLKKRDIFVLNNIDNDKLTKIQVRVLDYDKINVGAGTFKCLIVEPQMSGIGLFKKKGRLLIWLTNDKYKMPVMFKSKIFIGSISGKLESFKRVKD
ncbi:MAG: DUF3108 domain-containing protein, partial [Elusimicrobiota bacterium]